MPWLSRVRWPNTIAAFAALAAIVITAWPRGAGEPAVPASGIEPLRPPGSAPRIATVAPKAPVPAKRRQARRERPRPKRATRTRRAEQRRPVAPAPVHAAPAPVPMTSSRSAAPPAQAVDGGEFGLP
jgi:hypothetical protein